MIVCKEFMDQQLPPRNNNQVAGRSFPSLAIVEARRDVKRALLIATLEIKRDNPGQTADFAWTLLQDRLVRETVVERQSEVQQSGTSPSINQQDPTLNPFIKQI